MQVWRSNNLSQSAKWKMDEKMRMRCRRRRHPRLASLSPSTPASSATLAGTISTLSPKSSRLVHISIWENQSKYALHPLSEPKQKPSKGNLHFPASDHRHLCSCQCCLLRRPHSHWAALLKCCGSGRFTFYTTQLCLHVCSLLQKHTYLHRTELKKLDFTLYL